MLVYKSETDEHRELSIEVLRFSPLNKWHVVIEIKDDATDEVLHVRLDELTAGGLEAGLAIANATLRRKQADES